MLPSKIKDDIIQIENLFNNYEYMKKSEDELEQIKNLIIKIIKKLEDFKNPAIVDLVIKHQQHTGNQDNILNVNDVTNTSEFYQYCYAINNKFVNFLNKLKIRLQTLKIGKTEFTAKEKISFYDKSLYYIEENRIDLLEQLLNENLINIDTAHNIDLPPNWIIPPLILAACETNNLAIVKMLHSNNANLNVNINDNYENDVSPLLVAISHETPNNELIIYLLDNGASPNFIGGDAKTPLNQAIDNLELYQKMIKKYGANVNLQYPGGTPLIYACGNLKFEAIKILLANGANVNLRSGNGYPALHYLFGAFNNENQIADIKTTIDLFITNNFDFNFQNNFGDTIFHQLVSSFWGINIMKDLLNKNIIYNPNLLNNAHESVIHKLLNDAKDDDINNIIAIIDWFIKNNYDINCINNFGETILHVAVKLEKNLNLIEYLVNHGADINIVDYNGKSSWQLAKELKNQQILRVFDLMTNNQIPNIAKGEKRKCKTDENFQKRVCKK